MIDILNIAKKLSVKSQHPAEEWHAILNAAVHDPACAQMTDGEIYQLVDAVVTPEQMSWLLDLFRDNFVTMTTELPFDHIVAQAARTPFGLADWISALYDLDRSSSHSGIRMNLPQMTMKINSVIQNLDIAEAGQDLASLVSKKMK